MNSLEESIEREDTMYLYENEPFEKYRLKIFDIKHDRVHVFCEGIAITNGYSEPYISSPFELDAWIKIK